ncbi:hypothetical protein DRQ53_08030 [bacterium]|nr:MAG: hypothetical protein DRQ53_08030 [bacterium]
MYYYRFNVADWALHTAHLSPEEEGVYLRLINYYYDTETPIPDDKIQWLCRRLRMGSKTKKVQAILEEFFKLKRGNWHHNRCDLEVAAYHEKSDQNRLNGKRGGRPKGSKRPKKKAKTQAKAKITQPVNSGFPKKTLTTNQEPVTTNQEPRTNNQEPVTNCREEEKEKEKEPKKTRSKPDQNPTETPVVDGPATDIRDFHQRPGQDTFVMTMDWAPSEQFGDRAVVCGIPETAFDPHVFGEFKSYWSSRPEARNTMDAWEHKLIVQLRRAATKIEGAEERLKNARTRQTDKITHDQNIVSAIVGGAETW